MRVGTNTSNKWNYMDTYPILEYQIPNGYMLDTPFKVSKILYNI